MIGALTAWGLAQRPRQRLTGDVSPRQYHRVWLDDESTAVVMVTPLERAAQQHDWLVLRDWLAQRGVPVPAVLRRADERGVILLEDLGDCLLTEVDRPEPWYHATLDHLTSLEDAPGETPAHGRSLTEERLRWELRRFRKVVAAPLLDLDDEELALWKAGEDGLTAALLAAPQVWMHRDLHARNLLVHAGAACWVDFQDAMRGPWLYDLASLVFDPYAALGADSRAALRDYYLARSAARGPSEPLWLAVAVQRLVHCAACYVWVAEHVGNPAYLRYLPYTLARLREVLTACAPAAPLARVLDPRWELLARRWELLPRRWGREGVELG